MYQRAGRVLTSSTASSLTPHPLTPGLSVRARGFVSAITRSVAVSLTQVPDHDRLMMQYTVRNVAATSHRLATDRGGMIATSHRGCSSMVRVPAFQAGYAGSIPVTRSRLE